MRINSEMSVNAYNTQRKSEKAKEKPAAGMESDTVSLSTKAATGASAKKATHDVKDVANSIRQQYAQAFSAQANLTPKKVLNLLAE